jgi:hypothetical protein
MSEKIQVINLKDGQYKIESNKSVISISITDGKIHLWDFYNITGFNLEEYKDDVVIK